MTGLNRNGYCDGCTLTADKFEELSRKLGPPPEFVPSILTPHLVPLFRNALHSFPLKEFSLETIPADPNAAFGPSRSLRPEAFAAPQPKTVTFKARGLRVKINVDRERLREAREKLDRAVRADEKEEFMAKYPEPIAPAPWHLTRHDKVVNDEPAKERRGRFDVCRNCARKYRTWPGCCVVCKSERYTELRTWGPISWFRLLQLTIESWNTYGWEVWTDHAHESAEFPTVPVGYGFVDRDIWTDLVRLSPWPVAIVRRLWSKLIEKAYRKSDLERLTLKAHEAGKRLGAERGRKANRDTLEGLRGIQDTLEERLRDLRTKFAHACLCGASVPVFPGEFCEECGQVMPKREPCIPDGSIWKSGETATEAVQRLHELALRWETHFDSENRRARRYRERLALLEGPQRGSASITVRSKGNGLETEVRDSAGLLIPCQGIRWGIREPDGQAKLDLLGVFCDEVAIDHPEKKA